MTKTNTLWLTIRIHLGGTLAIEQRAASALEHSVVAGMSLPTPVQAVRSRAVTTLSLFTSQPVRWQFDTTHLKGTAVNLSIRKGDSYVS
jgi:hypothetical protein